MGQKPYEGIATFFKGRIESDIKPIQIIGVPYDGSNTGRPGTRLGPNAIRAASTFLTDGAHPEWGIDPQSFISDQSDISISNTDVAKSLKTIEDVAFSMHGGQSIPGRLLTAFVGGDHTITLGTLRAFSRVFPGLKVIHFDAHCDTWADHFGDPIGHGTWVRNAIDEKLIAPTDIIQIGLRSPVDPATKRWLPDQGAQVFSTRDAREFPPNELANVIRSVIGDAPTYLTFDIDVLDPSAAPGTGTPEVGGLSSAFIVDLLRDLMNFKPNIVGMDVVEVSPPHDHAGITALAAAQVLYEVICGRLHAAIPH
jgi:agmatinase